jgi:hypothetical protein
MDPSSLFTADGDAFSPTALATSPWSPEMLHGGPVAALLARQLEAVPTAAPMFPARLTVELWRPVTFEPYTVETQVIRGGRRVQVLEAAMVSPAGVTVARATLQQIAETEVDLPKDLDELDGTDRHPPTREQCRLRSGAMAVRGSGEPTAFHSHGVEHRATGAFLIGEPGRCTDWIRLCHGLLPGETPSPFVRVAAAADFGNGVSSVLPFDDYTFINPDLTIHLFRLPDDEWVCLDAITRIPTGTGAGSVGLAESALFDTRGRIGRALQSLLVTERS